MFLHDLAYNNRNLTTIAAPEKSVLYSAFDIAKSVSVNGYKIGLHSIVITILIKKKQRQSVYRVLLVSEKLF